MPQGSPCSPIISNLIGHVLDVRLAKLSKLNKCTYSRYADDLTFSTGQKIFPTSIAFPPDKDLCEWAPGEELERIIKRTGFRINSTKTRMQHKNSRQVVTGLVVNHKVNIKSEYYRTARSMCHSLFKSGIYYRNNKQEKKSADIVKQDLLKDILKALPRNLMSEIKKEVITVKPVSNTMNQLEGILSHIYHIKDSQDLRLLSEKNKEPTAICKLYSDFLFFKHFHHSERPVILCEGKTDIIYLKCAIRQLETEFPELVTIKNSQPEFNVQFLNYSKVVREVMHLSGGTSDIVTLLYTYHSKMKKFKCEGKKYPVIVLTDNDSGAKGIFQAIEKISKTKFKNNELFHFITDNLYVVAMPKKASGENTKIEDFFDKKTRATKIDNKTFYSDNVGQDSTKHYSKAIFAEKIIKMNQSNINFKKFRKILRRLTAAITDYSQ